MRSWLGVEAVMTAAVALREALGGAVVLPGIHFESEETTNPCRFFLSFFGVTRHRLLMFP
jgi:hypothetical protein